MIGHLFDAIIVPIDDAIAVTIKSKKSVGHTVTLVFNNNPNNICQSHQPKLFKHSSDKFISYDIWTHQKLSFPDIKY